MHSIPFAPYLHPLHGALQGEQVPVLFKYSVVPHTLGAPQAPLKSGWTAAFKQLRHLTFNVESYEHVAQYWVAGQPTHLSSAVFIWPTGHTTSGFKHWPLFEGAWPFVQAVHYTAVLPAGIMQVLQYLSGLLHCTHYVPLKYEPILQVGFSHFLSAFGV